ncbi:MAG: HYExAFE family protein [Pirellulales bacterium]
MAKRDNHYEAAFEAYLRERRLPYVAIDETRRSLLGGDSIKSLDFIVHSGDRASWLVDVKGRRFPAGDEQKQYWKNWSTRDDLRAMAAWEGLFGAGFQGLFVFAYAIVGDRSPLPAEQLASYRNRLYAFVGVRLCDYACFARPISAAWQTVALTSQKFREIARPVDEFFKLKKPMAVPRLSAFPAMATPATIER